MPKLHRLPLLPAALLLLSLPAAATTYTMVSDVDLAAQAPAIAEVTIQSSDVSPVQGLPATDYLVSVERVLQGDLPGSNLIVRVPGGVRPGGMALKIWGAPEFAPRDRAILFLAPNQDGSFHVLHLMLGAFREMRDASGTWTAERELAEAHQVSLPSRQEPGQEPVRNLAKFRDWLADRAIGLVRAPDYFVPVSRQPMGSIRQPSTFFNLNGNRLRWFEFDSGQTVQFRAHSSGQPGVPDGGFGEFQTAINTWNNAAATNIRYAYAGTTSANAGLDDFDDVNSILFDHALDDAFSCDTGGVLAIGGPWYDPDDRGVFHGETFIHVGGADIVVNAGLECFFNRSRNPTQAAAELFTHELGHTLGLGHSCGDARSGSCAGFPAKSDAIMRANIHDDGRGSRLGSDDLEGIQQLYGTGGTTGGNRGPAAPGTVRLTVNGRSIRVDWRDQSSNERGFKVYRATNSGALTLIATLAANVHTFTDSGLAANTRYTYQVSSFNNKGETRSSQVSARTPR
jgi:hypothetical protein